MTKSNTSTPKPIFAEIHKNDLVVFTGNSSIKTADKKQIINILNEFLSPTVGTLTIDIDNHIINIKWIPEGANVEADKLNRQALGFAKKRDFARAIDLWQEAISVFSGDPNYHFNLGVANYEKKAYNEAQQHLKQTVKICPIYFKAHFLLGTISSKLRKFDEATKNIRLGLLFNPKNPIALVNLGIIYSIQKDYSQAVQVFEKSISLSPKEPRAYLGLAKVYSALNDIDNANRCYRAVIKLDKEGKMATVAKRSIIAETTVADDSSDILVNDNRTPEELYADGYRAYIQGEYKKAIQAYSSYLRKSPNDADVWSSLAASQMRFGKTNDAIQSLKTAISKNSKKSLYYKQLAIAFDLVGLHEDAHTAAMQALDLGKKDSVTLGILGKSLCMLQKFIEAIPHLESSIKSNQNNFNSRYYLATAFSKTGQIEKAQQQLQEILWAKTNTPLKALAKQLLNNIRNA